MTDSTIEKSSKNSSIFQIVSEFVVRYPKYFGLLFFFILIEGFIAATAIVSMIPLTDYLLDPSLSSPNKITSFVVQIATHFDLRINFWVFGLLFVSLNILTGVFKVAIRYAILRIKYIVLRGLFDDALGTFFNARWEFFSGSGRGRLLNTLNKEMNTIGDTLGHIATQLAQFFQFFIYLSVPFWLNASMTMTALVLALSFGLPFLLINRISYKLGKLNTSTSNILLGTLSEILQSARIILGFGEQNQAKKQYLNAFDAHVDVTLKSQTLVTAVPAFFAPLGILAAVIALGMALNRNESLSELVAVLWSLLTALPILASLLHTNISINNFIPSYEQLVDLRVQATKHKEVQGAKLFKQLDQGITLQNVDFCYPNNKPVLTNLNLFIKKNQMTAIVGESGSGKSTITDLVLGLQSPTQGQLLIDDVPFNDWNQNSFRGRVGYIPQEPILFYASIRDNLLWAKSDAKEVDLWMALKLSNADYFVENLSEGIDTIVGERGVRLSGGQRQRIALARALLRKPDLLILDEATSSLDTDSELMIQKSIEELSHSVTILVVAHRLSTISKADKIYVLKLGKILEEGSFAELSNKDSSIFSGMLSNQNLKK